MPQLINAMFQRRTPYTAIYKGKEIRGCGDCGNNDAFPGVLPYIPTHKCILRSDGAGGFAIIYDPFNIPEDCPLKVVPVEAKE